MIGLKVNFAQTQSSALVTRLFLILKLNYSRKFWILCLFSEGLIETELRKDFNEFCRTMRIKLNFRNEPSQDFNETPAFRVKSSWKPRKGHPNLEVFLSKIEE